MAEEDPGVLKQLAGIGITILSILLAAVVSALRVRPYSEAGETWVPLHVTTYPALMALGLAVLVFSLLRLRQGQRAILDLGLVRLSVYHCAVIVGCLAYTAFALLLF